MITEHDFISPRWGHHVRPLGGKDKQEIIKKLFRKPIVRTYQEYWGHGTGLKEGDKVKVMDRDGRRPDMVTIGDIYDDLARRDFTINAIAIDENGKYLDPHNGLQDINDKIIRCVGSTDRLKEDSLRMLRALRFSITKDFDMTEDIEVVLHNDYSLLENISRERIAEELKLMFSFSTSRSFEMMVQYNNLFKFIFENCNVSLTSVLPHIK